MKFVEVFRHSKRGESKGLNEEGVVFKFDGEKLTGVDVKKLMK